MCVVTCLPVAVQGIVILGASASFLVARFSTAASSTSLHLSYVIIELGYISLHFISNTAGGSSPGADLLEGLH